MMNRTVVFLVLVFMTASCFVGIGAVSGSENEAPALTIVTETTVAAETATAAPAASILATHTPIRIDDDTKFASIASSEGWSGDGSESHPYVIQNYDINGSGYGYCIYIGNTTAHFIIWNCTLHHASGNSASYYANIGLQLYNTDDGVVENVTCYLNSHHGARLWFADSLYVGNSTFRGNRNDGLCVLACTGGLFRNLTAYGNNYNANGYAGIEFVNSVAPKLVESYIHDNKEYGMRIEGTTNFVIKNNQIVRNCGGMVGLYITSTSTGKVENNNISSNTGSGIEAFNSQVTIANNTISDNNRGSSGQAGLYISNSNLCIVKNNTMINNNDCLGIYINSCTNIDVKNNFIEKFDTDSNGITIAYGNHVNVIQNNISGYFRGIRYYQSPYAFVEYNWITKTGWAGIDVVSNSDDAVIRYNWLHDLSCGIYFDSTSTSEIYYNDLNNLHGWGIRLSYQCNSNKVLNNTVTINSNWWDWCFYSYYSTNNLIQNNTFYGQYGMIIDSNCDYTTIDRNKVFSMDSNCIYISSSTYTKIRNNVLSSKNSAALQMYSSSNNLVVNNTISNSNGGICIYYSQSCTFLLNNMTNCGFYLYGSISSEWDSHSIPISNKVNGKPVRYYSSQSGLTVAAGAGQVLLGSCSNINVVDQGLNYTTVGVEAGFCSDIYVNNVYCDNSNWFGLYFYQVTASKVGNSSAVKGTQNGFCAEQVQSIEVDNCTFNNCRETGVYLLSSSDCEFSENAVDDNQYGMYFQSCNGFDINRNSIRRNAYDGFVLDSCQNFVLDMNTFVNDDVIIWNTGSYWDTHQISTSNTVNGRALRNYVHTSNVVVPADTGEVLLYDTFNIKMKDLNLSDADVGIFSYDSRDLLVDGCDMSGNDYAGVYIENSFDLRMVNSKMDYCQEYGLYYNGNGAIIDNNTACGTQDYGFEVYWTDIIFTNNTANYNDNGIYIEADNSIISNNIANSNSYEGFYIDGNHMTITDNEARTNAWYGMYIDVYLNSVVKGNVIAQNNWSGMYFGSFYDSLFAGNSIVGNSIYGAYGSNIYYSVFKNNTFAYNAIGLYMDGPQYNDIYWNNFIDNQLNTYDSNGGGYYWNNRWNATYPLGGNYYSDYMGEDLKKGLMQDLVGSDGFGDTPYEVGGPYNATDWAPLMEPADNGLPTSFVVQPGAYWFKDRLTLQVSTQDTDGIGGTGLKYRYSPDNATWGDWNWYWFDEEAPYDYDVFLVEGEGYYQYYSMARDVFGNPELSKSTLEVEIASDLTTPVVAITGPAENELFSNASVVVNWTATDAMSGVASYSVKADGGVWTDVNTSLGYVFAGLSEGAHELYVMAFDAVGNNATDSVSVFIDLTDPSGWIQEPYDGAVYNSPNVYVQWTATDQYGGMHSGTDVKVDSGAWHTVYGSADTLTGLSEGKHTVYVRMTDNAGNSIEDSASFTVDLTAPTIGITAPAEGAILKGSNVDMTWNATDALSGIANVALSLDGWAWRGIGNSSAYQVNYLTDGPHTVEVKVYDWAGNTKTAMVNFTIDNKAPVVSVTWPTTAYINSREVSLVYSALDDHAIAGYTVKLDALSPIATADVSYTFTNLSEGAHSVTITATDTAGNAGNITVVFNIDITAPVITINIPVAGETTQTDINAEWNAVDASGIKSYDVKMDGGDWIPCWLSGTRAFIGLAVGNHTLTVKATDIAGNSAEKTVEFTIVEGSVVPTDKVLPKITGFSPSGDAVAIGTEVKVTFDEAIDPASVKYTCTPDPGGWTAFWSADGKTLALIHTAFAYETDYTFVITEAKDLAGNRMNGTATYTFKTVKETTGGGGGGDTGDQKSSTLPWIIVVILAVIILILLVVAVILSRKGKGGEEPPAKETPATEKPPKEKTEVEEKTEVVDEDEMVVDEPPAPEDVEVEEGETPSEPSEEAGEPEVEEDVDVEEVEDVDDADLPPPPPSDNKVSLKLDLGKETKSKK